MKKIIAIVFAAVLASAAFAENTFHLGLYAPISKFDIDDNDVASVGVGGTLDYTHVFDNGFTLKVGFDAGFVRSDIVKTSYRKDEAINGVDFALGVGVGGSFLHNDRFTLSLLCDFGYRMQIGYVKEEYLLWRDLETVSATFVFSVGPELVFTFRFNNHIGLFISENVLLDLGATAFRIENNGKELYKSDALRTVGITTTPKIGLAITL
ncbi:MAG: hypothetical protein IJP61_11255 [Treponema sp.]|nr:hypothetical protein [Treponema sp.]